MTWNFQFEKVRIRTPFIFYFTSLLVTSLRIYIWDQGDFLFLHNIGGPISPSMLNIYWFHCAGLLIILQSFFDDTFWFKTICLYLTPMFWHHHYGGISIWQIIFYAWCHNHCGYCSHIILLLKFIFLCSYVIDQCFSFLLTPCWCPYCAALPGKTLKKYLLVTLI